MPWTRFQFDDFELDLQAYELRSAGVAIRLERIPMKLLVLLVENRTKFVSREFIIAQLWRKAAWLESEHSLNTAVNELRRVLKENRNEPRYIQSVGGAGYRFTAAVRTEEAPAAAAGLGASPPAHMRPLRAASPAPSGAGLIALSIQALRQRSIKAPQRRIAAVAVLPFANLSPSAEKDYLADGMTDELIGALSRQTAARVSSRTTVMQFQGTRSTLPRIARKLEVDAMIEGTVVYAGDRVRISAQLIDARRNEPLWSNIYDRQCTDLLDVQREVTREISCRVAAKITALR